MIDGSDFIFHFQDENDGTELPEMGDGRGGQDII